MCRYVRGTRHRLDHHTFERALPQLAKDEPDEELLLLPRRPRQEIVELAAFLFDRSRTAEPSDPVERRIDLPERQRGPPQPPPRTRDRRGLIAFLRALTGRILNP